uniref:Uncharacterized protein n=1 Tax=Medicago truncatula TaxID=3880 RepID=A2Q263_MEDTR|nr:hypothetical protein MtrDRAFT_AC149210g14v2 [Medicago truncatula]
MLLPKKTEKAAAASNTPSKATKSPKEILNCLLKSVARRKLGERDCMRSENTERYGI